MKSKKKINILHNLNKKNKIDIRTKSAILIGRSEIISDPVRRDSTSLDMQDRVASGKRNIKNGKSQTILPRAITGNVGEKSVEILHQKARDIADEYFSESEQEVVRNLQDNLGSDRAVDDLESSTVRRRS